MNDAIKSMMSRYACRTQDDYVNALREIIQELTLLGLWRAKFFEHGAFYGGTALRVLYGLDRYSEDLDFSLLKPNPGFRWTPYGAALRRELQGFGFEVEFTAPPKRTTAIESAFVKAHTFGQLLVIDAGRDLLKGMHPQQLLSVKLEVDIDPPDAFRVETGYLLQPIPFAVQAYSLPDLFAGKLHAVLCRSWKNRVKGRDWYDLVWYVARHPLVHVKHLEQRMRQSGHYSEEGPLTREHLFQLLTERIEVLDIRQAKMDVERFVKDRQALALWSRDFFRDVITRIQTI
jgi:hypothetical protein